MYQQQVSVSRISTIRYIIISATAGALVAMTTIDAEPHGAANGLTPSILLIYTTYTLLAARHLLVVSITGGLLTALQLGLSAGLALQDLSITRQVSCNGYFTYKVITSTASSSLFIPLSS